jgi:hypothetical protein
MAAYLLGWKKPKGGFSFSGERVEELIERCKESSVLYHMDVSRPDRSLPGTFIHGLFLPVKWANRSMAALPELKARHSDRESKDGLNPGSYLMQLS